MKKHDNEATSVDISQTITDMYSVCVRGFVDYILLTNLFVNFSQFDAKLCLSLVSDVEATLPG